MSAVLDPSSALAVAATLGRAVNRLAALACAIDDIKRCFPDSEQRDRLIKAVEQAHEVAMYYDGLHNFGVYAGDES